MTEPRAAALPVSMAATAAQHSFWLLEAYRCMRLYKKPRREGEREEREKGVF